MFGNLMATGIYNHIYALLIIYTIFQLHNGLVSSKKGFNDLSEQYIKTNAAFIKIEIIDFEGNPVHQRQ